MLIETCSFLRPSLKANLQEHGFLYIHDIVSLLEKHCLLNNSTVNRELAEYTQECTSSQKLSISTATTANIVNNVQSTHNTKETSNVQCVVDIAIDESKSNKSINNHHEKNIVTSNYNHQQVQHYKNVNVAAVTATSSSSFTSSIPLSEVMMTEKQYGSDATKVNNKGFSSNEGKEYNNYNMRNTESASTLAKDLPFLSVFELFDLLHQFQTHYTTYNNNEFDNKHLEFCEKERVCSSQENSEDNKNININRKVAINECNNIKTCTDKENSFDVKETSFAESYANNYKQLPRTTYKMYSLRELMKRKTVITKQNTQEERFASSEICKRNKESSVRYELRHLTTSSSTLDSLLGNNEFQYHSKNKSSSFASPLDGMWPSTVTEISGPPGAGKTQLLMQLAVNATLPDKLFDSCDCFVERYCNECLFIDTEGSFVPERLQQIAEARVFEVQQYALRKHEQEEQENKLCNKQIQSSKLFDKETCRSNCNSSKSTTREEYNNITTEEVRLNVSDEIVEATQKLSQQEFTEIVTSTPIRTKAQISSNTVSDNSPDVREVDIHASLINTHFDVNSDVPYNNTERDTNITNVHTSKGDKKYTHDKSLSVKRKNKRSRSLRVVSRHKKDALELIMDNKCKYNGIIRETSVSTCRLSQTNDNHEGNEKNKGSVEEMVNNKNKNYLDEESSSKKSVNAKCNNDSESDVEMSLFKQSRRCEHEVQDVNKGNNFVDVVVDGDVDVDDSTCHNEKYVAVSKDEEESLQEEQKKIEKSRQTWLEVTHMYTLEYVLSHIHYIRVTDLATLMALLYDIPRLVQGAHTVNNAKASFTTFNINNNYRNVIKHTDNNLKPANDAKSARFSNLKLIVIDSIAEPFRSFMSCDIVNAQLNANISQTTSISHNKQMNEEPKMQMTKRQESFQESREQTIEEYNSFDNNNNINNNNNDDEDNDDSFINAFNEQKEMSFKESDNEQYTAQENNFHYCRHRQYNNINNCNNIADHRELIRRRSRLLFTCADMLQRYAQELELTIVVSNQMTSRSVLLPTELNNSNNEDDDDDDDHSKFSHVCMRSSDINSSKRTISGHKMKRSTVLVPALGDIWGSQIPIRVLLSFHHYQLPPSYQERQQKIQDKECNVVQHNDNRNDVYGRWRCREEVICCTTSNVNNSLNAKDDDNCNNNTNFVSSDAPRRIVSNTHQYRVARLLKSPYATRRECNFAITKKGIRDVNERNQK